MVVFQPLKEEPDLCWEADFFGAVLCDSQLAAERFGDAVIPARLPQTGQTRSESS